MKISMYLTARLALAIGMFVLASSSLAAVETRTDECETRHPMNDAWFTGPMLANTAATAPRGHYLIETYLYDVATRGRYERNGVRQSAPAQNSYGTLTYLIYAVTDSTAIGMIPTAGYNTASNGPSSAGPGAGDLTVQVQHRIARFQACRRVPEISLALQQTLPTGRYDRLGNRPSAGMGSGAYTVIPAVYSQMYFWMPNQRIVRMRLDVSDAISKSVKVEDVSVYGTQAGFRGTAKPGNSLFVDAAWEYSLTRRWVLALDATYRYTANTRVTGTYPSGSGSGQVSQNVVMDSGHSDAYGLAPAVEYSWKPWIGVLFGVRTYPAGHNTSMTITPAVAVNIFR